MTRARRRCGKLTEHSYLLPTSYEGLQGERRLVGFVHRSPQREADMDACLVETHKALHSYKRYRAADHLLGPTRLCIRSFDVQAGSASEPTAGYQQALLRYCAEGRDERSG